MQIAKESFESGSWLADQSPEHFFYLHKEAWRKKWVGGGVELAGDPYLEKLAISSFYYLLSSLPSVDSHRETNDFGGISSGGLANGGTKEPDRGECRASLELASIGVKLQTSAVLSVRTHTLTAYPKTSNL